MTTGLKDEAVLHSKPYPRPAFPHALLNLGRQFTPLPVRPSPKIYAFERVDSVDIAAINKYLVNIPELPWFGPGQALRLPSFNIEFVDSVLRVADDHVSVIESNHAVKVPSLNRSQVIMHFHPVFRENVNGMEARRRIKIIALSPLIDGWPECVGPNPHPAQPIFLILDRMIDATTQCPLFLTSSKILRDKFVQHRYSTLSVRSIDSWELASQPYTPLCVTFGVNQVGEALLISFLCAEQRGGQSHMTRYRQALIFNHPDHHHGPISRRCHPSKLRLGVRRQAIGRKFPALAIEGVELIPKLLRRPDEAGRIDLFLVHVGGGNVLGGQS